MTLLLLASCSLGPRPDSCEVDAECRGAFGYDHRCGADGYCVQADPEPRCAASYPPDLLTRPENHTDDILLVSLFQSQYDGPQVKAAELAVQEVEQEGGLDGRTFAILHCDNDDLPEVDDRSFEEATAWLVEYALDQLGAVALIGPATSDTALLGYDIAAPLGGLIISPSATSPLLTGYDVSPSTDEDPGLLWRTVPPDDLQAIAMAADLEQRGVASVGIINQVGAYGSSLADKVQELYPGTVQRWEFTNQNERNLGVQSAGQSTVEEVVFLSSEVSDIVAFLDSAALDDGFVTGAGKDVFLADAGADPFLLANASSNARTLLFPRIRGSRPQVPQGPVFDLFKISYAAAYDGEDASVAVFAPYAYDATWLALYGAAWSDAQEPQIDGLGMARGLRKLVDPGAIAPTPIQASSWGTVVSTFEQGQRIDIDGASGPLDFDEVTGEVSNPIEIWVIQGDDFVPVGVCQPDGSCAQL